MLAPGAPESDRQIAFSFPDVMRQQVYQQVGNSLNELNCLWETANVLRHPRVRAGQMLEAWDVVRIGQEPHVEHQVAIGRHAVAESEARDVDHDLRFVAG